jgi:hypothetical protein
MCEHTETCEICKKDSCKSCMRTCFNCKRRFCPNCISRIMSSNPYSLWPNPLAYFMPVACNDCKGIDNSDNSE